MVGAQGIYLHIPFCRRRCDYCHFAITANAPKRHRTFLDALRREWERRKAAVEHRSVVSIYFGGGTPSVLQPGQIQEVLSWLPSAQEVTLEVNPEDATPHKMAGYAAAGVNRVSIGVQTLHDPLLKAIGRRHTARQALDAIDTTYEAGITNISADLILELPHQTVGDVQESARQLVATPVTHLSLYNLTIEAPAPYFYRRASLRLPDQETGLEMLQTAVETVLEGGFERYEISAFARGPHQSQHNTGYWQGRPFLGLGPSASSYLDGVRTTNTPQLSAYLQQGDSTATIDALAAPARNRELLAIGLRMTDGVDLQSLSIDPASLAPLIDEGLLSLRGHRAHLTDRGVLLHDSVAAAII